MWTAARLRCVTLWGYNTHHWKYGWQGVGCCPKSVWLRGPPHVSHSGKAKNINRLPGSISQGTVPNAADVHASDNHTITVLLGHRHNSPFPLTGGLLSTWNFKCTQSHSRFQNLVGGQNH
jgi:hypothetical protein